jgi:mannose-6-phosphate isomerase-like protein (cupin superfamily)
VARSGDAAALADADTAGHPITVLARPMHVIHHSMLPGCFDEGCSTRTVAGAGVCQAPFEVQLHGLEPGAATAPLELTEARVVVALAGSGKLVLDSGPQRFHAPCTLLVPAGARFQLINNAATPLQLVSVFVPAVRPEVIQP